MKKYFGVIFVLVVTVIFLSGCFFDLVIPESDLNSEDTEDGVVPGKGTLKIYLTDASGNYKENDSGTYSAVYVTIYKVDGHIAGDDNGAEGSWEELKKWDEGLLVNLKELVDRSMLLASLELESNKYTQLRLFLMDEEEDTLIAWIVLKESESKIPLEIPSVYQTGIKLNRPFEIIEGWITKLTIDFDADKSVVKTGNGKYKLKPVIHMTSETFPEDQVLSEGSGSVSGTVSYYDSKDLELTGIGGASVSLSGGEYIFVYDATTSEVEYFVGKFELDNVPVGNCVLNVYNSGFDEYSESIVVAKDENTVVDVVFLVETPGGISGIVKDLDSGNLIEGATVNVTLSGGSTYIFNSFTETNTEGSFSIEQLPVGIYDLIASATGYASSSVSGIPVTEGSLNNLTTPIELVPEEPE